MHRVLLGHCGRKLYSKIHTIKMSLPLPKKKRFHIALFMIRVSRVYTTRNIRFIKIMALALI